MRTAEVKKYMQEIETPLPAPLKLNYPLDAEPKGRKERMLTRSKI